jgi:magnesium transporter
MKRIPMLKFLAGYKDKVGLPPGTLIPSNETISNEVKIRLISYQADIVQQEQFLEVEDALKIMGRTSYTSWLDIEGLSNIRVLETLSTELDIDKLWLEDVLNPNHRPKINEMDHYIFAILKWVSEKRPNKDFQLDQLSLFLGESFVISLHQAPLADVYTKLVDRIKKPQSRFRKGGADYLFYALVDSVVDSYFPVLQNIGHELENMDFKNIDPKTPKDVVDQKKRLLLLRNATIPTRDFLKKLLANKGPRLQEDSKIYFQDAFEHGVEITQTIETYDQLLDSFHQSYHLFLNKKTNEVMNTLTIFASIFIPLTFMAGIYGMNFKYIPELQWRYGYFICLGLMLAVGLSLYFYFRRKARV